MTFQKKEPLVRKQYKLTRNSTPLTYTIPNRNKPNLPLMYFDGKSNRALRYASNQQSPFEDEQDGNAIIQDITFIDGFLTVEKENQVLQKFLAIHPMNGRTFVEVDKAKDAAEELETLNLGIEAQSLAKDLDIENVERMSRVLFSTNTSTTSSKELRRDLIIYARKEPEHFINALNDPDVQTQSNVELFFDKGLLHFKNNQTEVFFHTPSNKTRMMKIPINMQDNPKGAVTSYLKSNDGIEHLKMLEDLL